MASKIDIISSALVLIGDAPLNSLSDASSAATVANKLYDTTVESLLTMHRWRFASAKVQLALLVAEPLNEWAYAFQLPSNLLQIQKIVPTTSYEVYENKLYANVSELAMDYTFRPVEARFPTYFVQALEYRLADKFSISLTENTAVNQQMIGQYDRAIAQAMFADANQRPNRPFTSAPFIDVR